MRKDRCRAADVIELDLDHDFEPGLPLELYLHSEVHRLKPHIRSLIHVHAPALVTLSSMREAPSQLLMLQASSGPPRCRCSSSRSWCATVPTRSA